MGKINKTQSKIPTKDLILFHRLSGDREEVMSVKTKLIFINPLLCQTGLGF